MQFEYTSHEGQSKKIKADFILRNHDGSIATFYRWHTVKCNDGTTYTGLQFWSHFDTWQGSVADQIELLKKLEPIK